MAYAEVSEVQARMKRAMSTDELARCEILLSDAAVMIDAFAKRAAADAKKLVSCSMVIRVLEAGEDSGVPVGANQGTQSALGYSQTWIYPTGGSSGELYLSKQEKKILGSGNSIGAYSPLQELALGNRAEDMP